jgi:2-dehydropantoate 2-reductase
MRIAIVAPGAVGGYFGVLLARSGETVSALARGAHLRAIAEHGLIAEGPRGTFSARLDASDDASRLGTADIVLFAVKLYGAAEAARSAAPLFGPRTLGISLLNGIDGHEIIGRELPGRTVVGGSAYVSAVIAAPGKLRYTSDMSAITFGAPADDALRAQATAFIASCSKAGFKADMVDDVTLDVPRLRQGRAHRDRGHVGLHRPRRTAARRADAAPRHDLRPAETAPRRHAGTMRRRAGRGRPQPLC